jgi:hypothetical protein
MLLALLLLTGCQEPFGTDRHDLEGFRVAGLSASPAGGPAGTEIVPTVALVVDGKLWSDDPVLLQWHWLNSGDVDEAEVITNADTPVATGPAPTLTMPDGPATLFLLATSPDGSAEERVMLDLGSVDATLGQLDINVRALDVMVDDLTEDDYTLDARANWEQTEQSTIPVGGFARIDVTADADTTIHFMISGTAGTFFELDAHTADWATAEVLGDEFVVSDHLSDGIFTHFALGVNGQGGTTFSPFEVIVGSAPSGFFTPNRRFIEADEVVSPGTQVTGVLVLDDTATSGIRLTNTALVDGPVVTSVLDCAQVVDGDFDPNWLATGACTRTDVADAMVTITATN